MKKIFLFFIIVIFMGCEDLVDEVDTNPNSLTADQIVPSSVLPGAQVANILVQCGHLMRISGLYSGQFVAYQSLYLNIYSYNLTAEESISTWERAYVNSLPNLRFIQREAQGDGLLTGIAKVVEANLMGTIAAYHGDVPYSEAVDPDIDDPLFDSQVAIFNRLIQLLDDAIDDLNSGGARNLTDDIFFNGNAAQWIAAANTLKARFYMYLRNYSSAYSAAQNGIKDPANDLLYRPTGEDGVAGTKNTFWEILNGSRTGDMGSRLSFTTALIDPNNADSRNHAKTDETARANYYTIVDNSGSANRGVVEENESMPIITYRENQMILAEAGFRAQGGATGLLHLNEFRVYLNNGGWINDNFIGDPKKYDPFVLEDFAPGGIENPDNIAQERALLREIIEEKYVSGYMSFLPFDDIRRWRKSDSDIAPNIPLNTPTAAAPPERLPYSSNELTSNANAPNPEPGIFAKTEINQ